LFIAGEAKGCDSADMKFVVLIVAAVSLSGCVVGTIAKTAGDVATLPVKVAGHAVDAATISQSEADENRGRELRKQDEERGRQYRAMLGRCKRGKPLPTDVCR
jgi:hypothetical protein